MGIHGHVVIQSACIKNGSSAVGEGGQIRLVDSCKNVEGPAMMTIIDSLECGRDNFWIFSDVDFRMVRLPKNDEAVQCVMTVFMVHAQIHRDC